MFAKYQQGCTVPRRNSLCHIEGIDCFARRGKCLPCFGNKTAEQRNCFLHLEIIVLKKSVVFAPQSDTANLQSDTKFAASNRGRWTLGELISNKNKQQFSKAGTFRCPAQQSVVMNVALGSRSALVGCRCSAAFDESDFVALVVKDQFVGEACHQDEPLT